MTALAAAPVPDAAETRCNASFEALMWALSRPGLVQTLPAPGWTGIAEALIDRECQVYCPDPAMARVLAGLGAQAAPLPQADHCFLSLATAEDLAQLQQVAVGSPLYPDAGATVLAEAQFAPDGGGLAPQGPGLPPPQRLRLSGPGIETTTPIWLGGLAPGLWALRAARCRYPAGFDLFLTCGAHLIGLPRSTRIEVL